MNMRFPLLPKWAVPYSKPGINDYESNTVLTQTARLYQAMQKMIEDYNKFVDEVNTEITNFKEDVNQSMDEFEAHITKTVHDYIETMDMKIAHQDRVIQEAIEEQNKTIEENNQAQNEKIDRAIAEQNKQILEAIQTQNETIANALNELKAQVESYILEMVENSFVNFDYNEETEELNLSLLSQATLNSVLGGEY